jgi:hypothetical protein
LPALAKILYHVEDNTNCLLGMVSVRNGKSKNGDHAFSVSRMQVSAFINQMFSGLANKFRRHFGERGWLGIFRECKSVTDIADHNACFVCFRLRIESSCALSKTTKFVFRETIGKECSYKMRAVPP